jgi:murein DD-endopeptidase MepM/ murein hydrolase activator NlpD
MEKRPAIPWNEKPLARWIANIIAVLAVAGLVFVIWQRVLAKPRSLNTPLPTAEVTAVDKVSIPEQPDSVTLNPIDENTEISNGGSLGEGISREIKFDTIIPSRPRVDVITYTVKQGDTLFDIADTFGIKPETLLWGNFEVLQDNPHLLSPDQVLNILPTNGIYYQWHSGDSVERIADQFKTDAKLILDYPGNHFDLTQITEGKVNVEPETWIIVPGGKRPLKDWGPPAITRSNPASARYYGEGSCGSVYEGAIGNGTFVWPTVNRSISGYNYFEGHKAIDIGGTQGDSIFAADNGVVVFSGWSNFGYGNLIVIDHGNGYQTAYAHLSAAAVTCGQSVSQGGYIGAMGSTGNSTGPHLHYELIFNGAKLNPLDFSR